MVAVLLLHAGIARSELIAEADQIKAAYLLKFIDYVEWPPTAFSTPTAPLVIGVVDADPVVNYLTAMATTQMVGPRAIVIRRLNRGDSIDGLHVIFLGSDGGTDLEHWLALTRDKPILCVTQWEEGLAKGSTINFATIDGKVRFDITPPTPAPNHVKVSVRLLSVARKVIPRSS